jgi:hypothetical protein
LQLRELAMFPSVIGKLVIREESSWNNVRTHDQREEIESTISAVGSTPRGQYT